MNEKSIAQKFRKLTEVEHVLARPNRYIGSIKPHTAMEWLPKDGKMVKREVTYCPGFLKMFDEVITNSADHSRRPEGKGLDVIRVEVDRKTGVISVYDNGGIPVLKHPEYQQWVPEMIFELRAGSNFDDDDGADLAGQNGEGAALTCIFSEYFNVETCDGKKRFKMKFTDNSQTRPEPTITDMPAGSKGYTKITYLAQFPLLELDGIDEDDFDMLYARTLEVAATNTHLKVYFNGERLLMNTFKDYMKMFDTATDETIVFDDTPFFKVGVMESGEGFQHTSFVSGGHTRSGGTHVTYVVNQIVDSVRAYIQKKHKVEIKPADVRNHLHLFIDCRIIKPRYDSQTKDNLVTEVKDYGAGRNWSVPEKFINRLLKTPIIQNILDWASAKADAELQKELRKAGKELKGYDPRKIDKFNDAMEKTQRHKCVLFLAEGDSASGSISGGRGDNPYIASFPLKGKPLNVREKEISRVLGLDKKKEKEAAGKKTEPNEIQKLLTIIGLEIGTPVRSLSQLRFGKVAFATDADVDGFHICGLLINLFDHFWPELFDLGFIHMLRTPVIVVKMKDKTKLEFFSERDFFEWESAVGNKTKGWSKEYYKGLSKWSTKQFAEFLSHTDQYLYKITSEDEEDKNAIDLAFNGERADDRKVWLETPPANFDDFIVHA